VHVGEPVLVATLRANLCELGQGRFDRVIEADR